MSTYMRANRIYTTDGSEITFDTNQPKLIWTNQLTGSIVRPQYRARSVGFGVEEFEDVDTTVNLKACSTFATDVSGMCRTVWSSPPSSNFGSLAAATTGGEWINVSGSLLELMLGGANDGEGITIGLSEVDRTRFIKGLLTVEFSCSGGQLKLREVCKLIPYVAEANGYTYTVTLPARTIHYNILCGYYG